MPIEKTKATATIQLAATNFILIAEKSVIAINKCLEDLKQFR